MKTQRKIFSGRVNSDADLSVFPETDLLNAENVSYVIAQDGSITSVKPTPGNRKITERIQLAGSVVVGAYEEKELGRLYYFLYNASTEHRIMMFDERTEAIRIVATGAYLGLGDTPITGVDKVGDILYWVQDDKPPKKINVERGLRTYNATYVSPNGSVPVIYVSPTAEDVELIRPYPRYAPLVSKQDNNRELNLIDDDAFQFAFSFVYRDYEFSVISPYSRAALQNSEDEEFDTIVVTMDSRQNIDYEVDKIRLHVRLGNTGSFFTIKEWRKDRDSQAIDLHNQGVQSLSYNFYNDTNGIAISEEYSAKLFDNVPISSRALAAAKNRLFLGNNVFGYEAVTQGTITAQAEAGEVGESSIWGTYVYASLIVNLFNPGDPNAVFGAGELTSNMLFIRVDSLDDSINGYYRLDSISYNGFFTNSLPANIVLDPLKRVLTLAEGDDDTLLELYLRNQLTISPEFQTVEVFLVNRTYAGGTPDGDALVYGIDGTPSVFDSGAAFKSGARYRVGVVFYDFAGRNSGVYSPEDAVVLIPDRDYQRPTAAPNIAVTLSFTSNQIPEWATHYQVVRTKSLTHQSFLQGFGTDIQYVGKDKDGNWQFADTPGAVLTDTFDTSKVQGVAINISPAVSFGMGYSFLEGDVLKLYFESGEKYTAEIIDTVGSYVVIQGKDIGSLTSAGKNHLFEIITPKRGFLEETFYEVASVHPVTNPGSPTRSLSATSVVLSGDITIKERTYELTGDGLVETMNPSDQHWKQWITDIGRPNIVILDGSRSVRPGSICYSNVRLADTQVNGLSSFDALDYVDLDSNAGPLRSLKLTIRTQEYGSIMLAICETETSSIYLGETRLVDNAGAAILATSGAVIGTINNLRGSYGTVNPESVAVDEGRVYFVDRINGLVVQYSQNGLTPISENGMARFFTENLYELDSSNRLYATVDGRTSEYCVFIPNEIGVNSLLGYDTTVIDPHEPAAGQVWRYHPEVNGWSTAQDFIPSWMACVSRYVLSFNGADLYIHDSSSMSYYGQAFKSIISFPIGSGDIEVKLPQSIGIASSVAPEWTHLKSDQPFIQGTDLVADEYAHMESMFYASFLRDRLSPGHTTYEEALIFGEQVRGLYLPLAIQFDQNFAMNTVVVQYDVSRGHAMLQS
jgi:hypothetical protein